MILRRAEGHTPWKIIDIHSHVLPGLDDGSRDMDETMDMLRMASREGISDMIVTPHFHMGRHTASPDTVMRALCEVQEAAKAERIPIRLYPGNEIYFFGEMAEYLQNQQIFSLNGSGCVLIEFSPTVMFRTMQNAMDVTISAGYQPILAHVERYECLVKGIDGVALLRDMGVQIQVNASTVVGKSGPERKRFAHQLLKSGIVDYVGTDAHGRDYRTPEAARCRELIIKKYGDDYAKAIMHGNARALLE